MIPAELKAFAASGVVVDVKQTRFRLHRDDAGDPPHSVCDMRGRVGPVGDGSRIVARVGVAHGTFGVTVLGAALAVWLAFSRDLTDVTVCVAVVAGLLVVHYTLDRRITRTDPLAKNLVERLELALSHVAAAGSAR